MQISLSRNQIFMLRPFVFMVLGEQLLRIVALITALSTTVMTMHVLDAADFIVHQLKRSWVLALYTSLHCDSIE